jgi:hypothetical protein
VEGAQRRQKAIIADEKGEVNRDKPTITVSFLANVKSFLNRQLIRGIQRK